MSWIDNNSATIPTWNYTGTYPYRRLNRTVVQGTIDISGGNIILRNGGLFTQTDISSNGNLYAAKSYISGNLAIGKTTAGYTLDISGTAQIINSSSLTSTNLMIDNNYTPFTAGNTTTSKISLYAQGLGGSIQAFNTYATAQGLIFNTFNGSDVERMRITNSGNVGIGTTTPAYPLEVNGSINVIGTIRSYTAGTDTQGVFYTSVSGVLNIEAANAANNIKKNVCISAYGGNVGIGTSTPGYKFEINGDCRVYNGAFIAQYYSTVTDMRLTSPSGNNININIDKSTGTGDIIMNYNSLNSNVYISRGQLYVQAGSVYVTYGIKIDGVLSDSLTTSTNIYYNNNSNGSWNLYGAIYGGANNWSIYAASRICGSEFWLKSDIRIKKNIEPIENSIDIIRKLQPKKYNYIDIANGTNDRYGFIAQEVEKILPGSVNVDTSGEFVPNIFKLATITKQQYYHNIRLPVDNTTIIVVNDTVKVITKTNKTVELTVISIESTHSFNVVGLDEDHDSEIFVYGTKVYDFKTVDYNDAVCITISAVKELDNKMNEVLRRLAILENHLQINKIGLP